MVSSTVEVYTYDPLSRMTSAEDADSKVEWTYDLGSRVTDQTVCYRPLSGRIVSQISGSTIWVKKSPFSHALRSRRSFHGKPAEDQGLEFSSLEIRFFPVSSYGLGDPLVVFPS